MRTPKFDMNIFRSRRKDLAASVEGGALVLSAHPEYIRNNDVHFPYRQDSNFFYLTGFEEPDALFVFRPGRTPETALFVRPKDPERETWDGFRYGPEETKKLFQVEATYLISDFEKEAVGLLSAVDKVFYQLYFNRDRDEQIRKVLEAVKTKNGRSGRGLLAIEDPRPLIGEMRIKKRPEEIDLMKTTCRVSAEAHCEVMRAVRPGISERALHGIFLKAIMERGAAREGYGAILASGSNATTLHYVFNDQICREGDLILVDAGAECDYYTGDITRTYPVNGKFSEAQKRIYHKVLRLQKELIQCVRPGQTLANLQKHTISVLVDIMIEEKLLKGNPVDLISNLAFRKYYPHGVGHWLGSDVHDAGLADLKGEARTLEPGFCLTIEPGIYIPAGDQGAPESLRGIGIRIEDNILVTADGCDVLTSAAPKEIDELEALIGSGLS